MKRLPKEELISIAKAAKTIGVHIETLRRWDKAGKIKARRTTGGQRRFLKSGILKIQKLYRPESLQSETSTKKLKNSNRNSRINERGSFIYFGLIVLLFAYFFLLPKSSYFLDSAQKLSQAFDTAKQGIGEKLYSFAPGIFNAPETLKGKTEEFVYNYDLVKQGVGEKLYSFSLDTFNKSQTLSQKRQEFSFAFDLVMQGAGEQIYTFAPNLFGERRNSKAVLGVETLIVPLFEEVKLFAQNFLPKAAEPFSKVISFVKNINFATIAIPLVGKPVPGAISLSPPDHFAGNVVVDKDLKVGGTLTVKKVKTDILDPYLIENEGSVQSTLQITSVGDISLEPQGNTVIGNLVISNSGNITGVNNLATGGTITSYKLQVTNAATFGTINGNTFTDKKLVFLGDSPTIYPATTNSGISLNGNGTGAINIGNSGTGDVYIAGGSGDGGCTITNSSGTLNCSSNITTAGDLIVNGSDIITDSTALRFNVANTGTISFKDGTNTLLSIADGGTVGNVTITGTLGVTGATTLSSTLGVTGASTFTGNATFDGTATFNSTATFNNNVSVSTGGQLTLTRVPTQAHTGTWAIGSSTWNQSDATIYVNPASATADSNIFALAVGSSVKFDIDAEGDVYANNLILTGSTTQSSTTVSADLTVEGNTTLGDATTDTLTVNATSTFNTDVNFVFAGTENFATTSNLAGTVDVFSIVGTPSSSAGTTRGISIQQANSANTNGLDTGILIDNADADLALTTGIQITNSGGGGFTTLIDTTSFDVSGTGAISGATGLSSSGTITFSGVTASRFVATDASSNLATTADSAALINTLSDETGSGVAVFGTSPNITTSLTTGSTTFALVNTTATTVNFAGAATTLSVGASTGTTTVNNALTSTSTLTASNGFTQTTGALSLTGTSGSIALTGFGTTAITSTTTSGDVIAATDTSLTGASANLANFTFKNNNTGVGVEVRGITITEQAAATPSSGTNTSNLLNLSAAAGGTVNGVNISSATGFTNFFKTPTFNLDSSGNVSGVPTLTATNLGGTLSTAAQTNVTSVGTLTSLTVSGNINSTGGALQTNSVTRIDNSGNVTAGTGSFSGTVTIGSGTGKVDVGTVDPPYTIGGEKYATYVSGLTGQKEETTGSVNLGKDKKHEIDFAASLKASDLWLFYQITNFGRNWENLTVLLTPGFDGRVWYTKDPLNKKIIIEGSNAGEVSYRLTAGRFDFDKWLNTRPENDKTPGFVLPLKSN